MTDDILIRPATDESDATFLRGMVARMDTAFFSYGKAARNYTGTYTKVFVTTFANLLTTFLRTWEVRQSTTANGNAILFALKRLKAYMETGNTEYLMDAANGLMIEYAHPQHPTAFFKATDADGSTGFAGMSEGEMERFRKQHPGT